MTLNTIRSEAKLGFVPEYRLREMLRKGELPGFYAGSRYYVHHELLMEKLEADCRANMGEKVVSE